MSSTHSLARNILIEVQEDLDVGNGLEDGTGIDDDNGSDDDNSSTPAPKRRKVCAHCLFFYDGVVRKSNLDVTIMKISYRMYPLSELNTSLLSMEK